MFDFHRLPPAPLTAHVADKRIPPYYPEVLALLSCERMARIWIWVGVKPEAAQRSETMPLVEYQVPQQRSEPKPEPFPTC